MKHNSTLLLIGLLTPSITCLLAAPPYLPPSPEYTTTTTRIEIPRFPTPPMPVAPAPGQEEPGASLASLTVDQTMSFLQKFIDSESEDHIVTSLEELPVTKSKQIIERIIASAAPSTFAAYIILGLADHYQANKSEQDQLFSLFETYPALSKGTPLLLIAVDSLYPASVNHLLAWAQTARRTSPFLSPQSLINNALFHAIARNNVTQLKKLHQYAHLISPQKASALLWHAVKTNRDPSVLTFLVQQGADLNLEREGKTVLLLAVENLNYQGVATLIALAQKDPRIHITQWINHSAAPTTETPLQNAIRLQTNTQLPDNQRATAAQLELLLRNYGGSINEA